MIYRRSQPEDKPGIMAVLRESFDGWHGDRNEAYWEWKFERNPHGRAQIWVCDDGGTIVGCYVLSLARLGLGDTVILGAQAVDAAVHPDHQGRGIFGGLARAATETAADNGIDVVFAFPSAGAFGGQIRAGFQQLMAVPKVYRPLPGLFSRRPRSDDVVCRRIERFDERFDSIKSEAGQAVVSQRDARYLEWRYNEHPEWEYETIVCEQQGDVCGYAVLFVDGSRWSSPGYIVDFQVAQRHDSVAVMVMGEALQRLRSLGARVAVTWSRPDSPEQRALRSSGFSSRYVSLRHKIERPSYIDQFIAFDVGTVPELEGFTRGWSLVPGDADYT